MAIFDYSKLCIFDKNGFELPISVNSAYKITIPSRNGKPAIFYPIADQEGSIIGYKKESSGTRFDGSVTTVNCIIGDIQTKAVVEYEPYSVINDNGDDTAIQEYSIKNITSIVLPEEKLNYPSATFDSFVNFKPVSTELVETESLYLFVKTETGEYEKISDYDPDFGNRYELLFFIDCRSQEDFRLFRIENDDVIWSDRIFVNLNTQNEDSYRVNIGFKSVEEGAFKETLHICLIDRGAGKSISRENADITIIGNIELSAESIGEDERYRTLFTNFGIPDPKEYSGLFANTSDEDDKTDNILLNQNSKKMFLAYPEIFPYVGTYKALANAVNVLGYDDIFFKEWYKRTGVTNKSGYVAYDMTYNSDIKANIINNVPLEERIHLKKLNWLSMVYKINEELADLPEDKYGFPAVESNYDFSHEDTIVKLVSLRDWLQKYIIGVNCRIIDIGGEGIYFERYFNGAYSTYEEVISWDKENQISPEVVESNGNSDGYIYTFMKQIMQYGGGGINRKYTEVDGPKVNYYANWDEHQKNYNNPKPNYLVETGDTIRVSLGLSTLNDTLKKYKDKRFSDFADGYIDSDNQIHPAYMNDMRKVDVDNRNVDIIYGNTLQAMSRINRYQIRASAKCDNFIFGEDWVEGSALWIQDNNMYLSPLDIHNGKGTSANFKILPDIYLKRGTVHVCDKNTGLIQKTIKISSDTEIPIPFKDSFFDLDNPRKASTDMKFMFKEESVHGTPVFILNNYYAFALNDAINYDEYKYDFSNIDLLILDIDDGYFTFNGPQISLSEEYLKHFNIKQTETISIHFKTDETGNRNISVNVVYETQEFFPKMYVISYDDEYDEEITDVQHADQIASPVLNNSISEYAGTAFSYKYWQLASGYPTWVSPTERIILKDGIIYNDIVPINVRYAGEYQIDVFGKDQQNNIFAAKCPKPAIVKSPNYSSVTYSNAENSIDKIVVGDERNKIRKDYINYCIYRKEMNNLFTKDPDSEIGVNYTRHYKTTSIPEAGDYIHFSNKLEKFELNQDIDEASRVISTGNSTEDYYELPDGTQIPLNEGYILYLKKAVKDSRYTYNDVPVSNQSYMNSMFDNSDHDVNVVFYNELGGYPVYQSYGILKKDINSQSGDGWILEMTDSTDQEYIWILAGEPSDFYYEDRVQYLKRSGIVTKKVGEKLYYAASYKKDNEFYYLKTINMSPSTEKIGDVRQRPQNQDSEIKLNFTFDITKLARMNGIGIYIQPTNMVNVIVSDKNPHYDSAVPGSKEDLENQLQIQIASSRNINVSPGDMVKIIFSSNINNLHFIQAAYKVVEVNSAYLIVEGKINGAYIRIIGNNIFYNTGVEYIKTAGQPAADFWTNDFIPKLKARPDGIPADMDINIIDPNKTVGLYKKQLSETEFDDNGNPKIEYVLTSYPACEYETVIDVNGQRNVRRTTFVTLPVLDANGNEPENPTEYNVFEIINTANSQPVRTSEIVQDENVNTYMTYSHTAYVDYVMMMQDNPVISDNEIHIDIPATRHNKWLFDYIDTKFVLSNRNFDTNNGIYSWMDILDPLAARLDPFGGEPIIFDNYKQIYKYDKPTETPVLNQNNSLLVISPMEVTNENMYWRIWKRSAKGNERTLMFESYNPKLYLDMTDTGIYDIEMNVCDKLGNVSTNLIRGAFKVV